LAFKAGTRPFEAGPEAGAEVVVAEPRPHRGSAAMDECEAAITAAVVAALGRVRAEYEAAEEDDSDDEHDPRHDADPCGDGSQP
jgi:hypothetical protein